MRSDHHKQLPDGWTVQTLRSLEDIESVRSIWKTLHAAQPRPSIDADIDRYLAVVRSSGADCTPYVLLLRRSGSPQVLVVARHGLHCIPIRLGYKIFVRPQLRCLTVVHGGIIGKLDDATRAYAISELLRPLRCREVDLVHFNHLTCGTPLHSQLVSTSRPFCRDHMPKYMLHWRMAIPVSLDAFYKGLSRKHRANLRRSIRAFENDFRDTCAYIHHRGSTIDVPSLTHDVEALSATTYQHGMNAGFTSNATYTTIMDTDARMNRIIMSLLVVDEQPIAYQWGTLSNNVYFLEKIGYDPRWRDHGVGNILFIKVLDLLCNEGHAQYIDFGFGDADYKRSYGTESWTEATRYIFAPRPYPLLINGLVSANAALTHVLQRTVDKLGMTAWLKRIWRRKLATRASHSGADG